MNRYFFLPILVFLLTSCATTSTEYEEGSRQFEGGEFACAADHFTRAIAADSSNVQYFLHRAQTYIALHKYQPAIDDCNAVIRLDSSNVKAVHARAYVEQIIGEYDHSYFDYCRALSLDSLDPKIWLNRGNPRLDLEDTVSALADYSHALQINPNDHLALLNRARLLREQGDSLSTFRDLDRALLVSPDDFHNHIELGMAHLAFRNYAAAIAEFDSVLSKDSTSADAHFGTGCALFHQKRLLEALKSLNRAILLQPLDSEGFYYRALTYLGLGNLPRACDDYQEALDLGLDSQADSLQALCR